MSLHEDLQAVLEAHEPMVDGWVIAYETTTLDDDGDLGGGYGIEVAGGTTKALGLLEITRARILHSFTSSYDD